MGGTTATGEATDPRLTVARTLTVPATRARYAAVFVTGTSSCEVGPAALIGDSGTCTDVMASPKGGARGASCNRASTGLGRDGS